MEQGIFTRSGGFLLENQRNLVPESPEQSVLQNDPLNAIDPVLTLLKSIEIGEKKGFRVK